MNVSKDLKIEIRPIPNRDGIKQFSDNLEYFSQAHTLSPFVDPVTLKYATGLDEEDVEYLKKRNFPYNINDDYVRGVPHEFWESQLVKVALKNNPIFLFPGKNIMDFIKWKYLLVNSYIYNSEAEMETGSKPEATHYIYDESEETGSKASKLEARNELIRQIGKLSLKRKRDIVLILLDENTDNKDEDYLTVKFDEIVNNKEQASNLKVLLDKDVSEVTMEAEIKSAIQKNVLKRTKKGIFYFETNLGYSEAEVQEFLGKDENQELYLTITSKL